jgi:hypothetical protein
MADFGWSYPAGCSGVPADDEPEETVDRRPEVITTLVELCAHFDADEPRSLNRRLYKDTDCGASISVQTLDGVWHHNGEDWNGIATIQAFTIQSIVEGSDAEVNSGTFTLPVEALEVDEWIDYMEEETERLWNEANAEEEDADDE